MSRRYPSTYEAPVFRLLKYAFIIWLAGVFIGVVVMLIGYQTSWWQQIGTATLNFHIVNPWFLLIYGGFASVAVLYVRFERRKKSKEEEKKRNYLHPHVVAS